MKNFRLKTEKICCVSTWDSLGQVGTVSVQRRLGRDKLLELVIFVIITQNQAILPVVPIFNLPRLLLTSSCHISHVSTVCASAYAEVI